jgi:hypothetical protein
VANCYKKCYYLAQRNGSKLFAVGTASSLVSSHHSCDMSFAFWFYKKNIEVFASFYFLFTLVLCALLDLYSLALALTKVKQTRDFAVQV